jgi:O-antigen ligase
VNARQYDAEGITARVPLVREGRSRRSVELAVAVVAAAVAGIAVGAGVNWAIPFITVAAVGLLVLGLARPGAFLVALLLIRPLLDRYEESKVHLGGIAINMSGAIALILIAVTAVVVWRAKPRQWPSGTKLYALVLILSVAASGLALAYAPSEPHTKPVAELVRLLALGAVYVLATNLVYGGRSSPRVLFVAAAVAAVVPAIVGLEQWFVGLPTAEGLTITRIYGTFSGPNAFGEYLAAAALILVFLPATWLPRWPRVAALAVVGIAMLESFSRAGWAMFFIGLVGLGWRNHKRLVAGALVLALVLGLAVPGIRHRVFSEDIAPGQTSAAIPASYQWRIDTWRYLLEKYSNRPLTGYGLSSTSYVNPRRHLNETGELVGFDAHSTLVKLLVEGGPLLLATWALFLGFMIARAWQMARKRWSYRSLSLIVLALWAIVVVLGLTTDDLLDATALMIVVFTLTGAVEGAWRRAGLARAQN